MTSKPIFVTRPFLPPLEEFLPYLEEIWDTRQLTNCGPFHQRFAAALAEYLGVPYVALFANGTLALMTALQALQITGEVITTPYTFVATSHALLWNGLRPVFVDVDRATCNLDPAKISEAVTPDTTAIMPVHCYGNPCNTELIQAIADTHGLKVIYDAAHAFGVSWQGRSLLDAGDLSVLSFHATKIFNTFEGGAIICHDSQMKERIDFLKNFGFADEVTVMAPGINGKMNELQAALGLLQLEYMGEVLGQRAAIAQRYVRGLETVTGIHCLETQNGAQGNDAYFPIFVSPEYPATRDGLYNCLRESGIFARRYFYPSINNLPMYRALPSARPENLPVATMLSESVICLPIYPGLSDDDVDKVIAIVAVPSRCQQHR